jgi:hypothetical protein
MRSDFDDVDDYNGSADAGARDQFGTALGALSQYTVRVTVTPSTALTSAGRRCRADRRARHVSPERHRRADGLSDEASSDARPFDVRAEAGAYGGPDCVSRRLQTKITDAT